MKFVYEPVDFVYLVVALIILAMALIVLRALYKMDLSELISELDSSGSTRKASLSRFQFLLFTFVIAGLYLSLSIESGTLIDVPQGVLILLGISGGGYVASKTLSKK